MNPNTIMQVQNSSDRIVTAYENHSTIMRRIRERLEARYGQHYRLYMDEGCLEDYWDMLERDIQDSDPGVEHIAEIYDSVETRSFDYHDEDYRLYPSVRNNVFAYPEWGVAFSRVPEYRPHGIGYEDFVWAVDDEHLQRFLERCRERRRTMDRQQVTVFTDEREGVDKALTPITVMVDRDDVIMHDDLKKEIFRSIDRFFADDRSFFQEFGIPYKRGILLYGKPGNGKTTLVKSIAGSVEAPVAYWQITQHTSSDSIQEVFAAAQAMAPMILVVEDIDSMPESARSYFLNTLDGATSKEGIFLIGTTNYPEKIDPALMNRAGRFDRAYEIKLPDAELRQRYLGKKGLGKLMREEDVTETAKLTEGFTFAQLNEVYVSAALEWYEERTVNMEALIKRMKTDLHKGKTHNWMQTGDGPRVGFVAM